MKVLIACEESQTVCMAFRERGHEAYSCDIQEPSGGHPEQHILGDAMEQLKQLIQAFPSDEAAQAAMNRAADFLTGALGAAKLAEKQEAK